MDAEGHIYEAPEGDVPAEDKARLDGYLRGRAEAEKLRKIDLEKLRRIEERLNEPI